MSDQAPSPSDTQDNQSQGNAPTPIAATPNPATPNPTPSVVGTPAPQVPATPAAIVTPSRPPRGPSRVNASAAAAAAGLTASRTPRNTPGGPPVSPGYATPSSGPNVVGGTPAPFSPGLHRRELGLSPVRLTPGSQTPGAGPATPGTPASQDGTQEQQLVLWGTTINIEDTENRFTKFVKEFKTDGSEVIVYMDLLHHMAETGGSVVNVDMMHLFEFDSGMYRKMLAYPNELISVFDAVVSKVFALEHPEEADAIREKRRKDLQVRTFNLKPDHVQSMRELNPKDISTLVAVRGMVIRASNVIPDIQRAMYRCTKCNAMVDVEIQYGRIEEPRRCRSCNTRDSFTLIHSRSSFSDKQTVRLQEAPEAIPKGETPATFTLIMYDSLVDVVKPGDRVEITGILRATPIRINAKQRTVRSVYRTYIDCVHVRTLNNNQARKIADAQRAAFGEKDALGQPVRPGDGVAMNMDTYTETQREARTQFFETLSCHPALYERLANSLAPSIFGMTDEKKGVLLQLFGGASKASVGQANAEKQSDGSARFRSAINILLVGDPGTSKSQLLHSAHRLAPRGVYTSGRGSSAVGLTAYVTRDPDTEDYVLESGALVLSDRGVCCIDEFDKMSDFARSVLHEAMEQQTVSIAKAGIIATLNARTAVLAAANPVNSRYDTSKSVVDNIDLPPTLLSRFDLIYLVLDAPNADEDRKLAQHIVSLFFKNYDESSSAPAQDDAGNASEEEEEEDLLMTRRYASGELVDSQTLTEYIAYAREKVDPKLSSEASEALVKGYLEMRSGGRGGNNMTATPRQLESLIRLAEAHARMHLRDTVEEEDVEEAKRLVKCALRTAAMDPHTGKIDMNLFAAGKSRAMEGKTDMLGDVIVDKLREDRFDGKDVRTGVLMMALREQSDVEISPGEFREALRRLVQMEKVVMKNSGLAVRLIC